MISIRSQSQVSSVEFALCFAVVAVSAAMMAICAPIALSIATVFLFAGPHNWMELRYFLSRLPARFGKFKKFFAWSFGGIGVLMASYIALTLLLHGNFGTGIIGGSMLSASLLAVWNCLFIFWIVRLIQLSGSWKEERDRGLALPFGFLAMAFACSFPAWFGLALVYLHPLIGCWILDREMARSKPGWRSTYHLCLMSLPLFLCAIWFCLNGAAPVYTDNMLTNQIQNYSGALLMPGVSSRLLVALHTFLEVVHYAVWLIAIPLVSAGWTRWQPNSIPITYRAPQFKKLIPAVLSASTFVMVVLWFCFTFNYSVTRDVYFTLAMAHVLAEVPFLLKTLT